MKTYPITAVQTPACNEWRSKRTGVSTGASTPSFASAFTAVVTLTRFPDERIALPATVPRPMPRTARAEPLIDATSPVVDQM